MLPSANHIVDTFALTHPSSLNHPQNQSRLAIDAQRDLPPRAENNVKRTSLQGNVFIRLDSRYLYVWICPSPRSASKRDVPYHRTLVHSFRNNIRKGYLHSIDLITFSVIFHWLLPCPFFEDIHHASPNSPPFQGVFSLDFVSPSYLNHLTSQRSKFPSLLQAFSSTTRKLEVNDNNSLRTMASLPPDTVELLMSNPLNGQLIYLFRISKVSTS